MILQINFSLNVPVSEYEALSESVAQAFADVPGLRWKIWLLNAAGQEAGGIYLFDSEASIDAFLAGPIGAKLRTLTAIRNVSIKRFDVMPEVTALTRGPVEVAATTSS